MADSRVFPNPRVGSVIVHQDTIIGEGFHAYAGGPHAEVVAIRSVRNPQLLSQSTLYVSLEPCSHYGKTPPCAHLIVEKGIPNVVVGSMDPNPQVAGRGIAYLRDHGVKVEIAGDDTPFRALNRPFFTNQLKKRPYVILKWAESGNGFVAGIKPEGSPMPVMLTGSAARTWVHGLRARNHAILIGRRTALADDPLLTVRNYPGRHPLRIVLDPDLRLPESLHLMHDGLPTLVLNRSRNTHEEALRYCATDTWGNPAAMMQHLYNECGVCSVLIEGGPATLQPFLDTGMFDIAYRLIAPKLLLQGVSAPHLPEHIQLSGREMLGKDELLTYSPGK